MIKYTPDVRNERTPIIKAAIEQNVIATSQIIGIDFVPSIKNGHSTNAEYVCA